MMKLVACATLVVAAFLAAAQAERMSERAGYVQNMIPRLGHFNEKPYIDLYKTYAAAFVLPKHPERPKDDYRNYMPSGDECMIFFKRFRINQYKLSSLDEFVVMDACLGYLYNNADQQQIDTETSTQVKNLVEQLKEDENLAQLFQNTKVNELSDQGKECVADLLLNVIVAKHQYPTVVCNNQFLQVFLQFAECQQGQIDAEQRQSDSYLNKLYSLLRDTVGLCVNHEIGHIETAVRLAYEHNRPRRILNKIKGRFSSMHKQAAERMWPHQVTTLLAAVQNTTDEVNPREVHQLIRGVIVGDEQLRQRLLTHMAEYADKKIAPQANSKASNMDPSGLMRYNNLIDNLCNYFRTSDKESMYDFATPIIRLVQLLAHEDLFGITQREFVTKMLTHAKESSPIYLSVQACNILTFTEGAIDMPMANTKQHYNVVFKQDTRGMILWPDAGYY